MRAFGNAKASMRLLARPACSAIPLDLGLYKVASGRDHMLELGPLAWKCLAGKGDYRRTKGSEPKLQENHMPNCLPKCTLLINDPAGPPSLWCLKLSDPSARDLLTQKTNTKHLGQPDIPKSKSFCNEARYQPRFLGLRGRVRKRKVHE